MMLADCVRPRIEDPLPALRTPEVRHAPECTTGTYSRPKCPSELPGVYLDRPARCGPLFVRPLEDVQASVCRTGSNGTPAQRRTLEFRATQGSLSRGPGCTSRREGTAGR